MSAIKITQHQIDGLPDIELNQPRTRPVSYRLFSPKGVSADAPAKGLFVYIPGFGDDANDSYVEKLLTTIAQEFNYIGLSVRYHCINARPSNGGQLHLVSESEERLLGLCVLYNVQYDKHDLFGTIHRIGQLDRPSMFNAKILPPDNEYQNFGVLQALDHLCVINQLIQEDIPADLNNIVLMGSSHGGFIAHLVAKFAPNTINAIIDNSSYVRTPPMYLGIDQEVTMGFGKAMVKACVITHWQFAFPGLPNFFGVPQALIREVCNKSHLAEMTQNATRTPQVFAFNSTPDIISPLQDKQRQAQRYQQFGIDYDLTVVDESKIDGVLFKSLDHGMGASLKTLAQHTLPNIQTRPTELDYHRQTQLDFDCLDLLYTIQHTSKAPYITWQLNPIT